MMFFMTCLYLFADVCTDTLAVERSRYEPDAIRGSLQTSCYTIRSFGSIIGALLGALLYNSSTWGWGLDISQCFFLSGIIPGNMVMI
jgi:predicted branched-subunit amino acid permease